MANAYNSRFCNLDFLVFFEGMSYMSCTLCLSANMSHKHTDLARVFHTPLQRYHATNFALIHLCRTRNFKTEIMRTSLITTGVLAALASAQMHDTNHYTTTIIQKTHVTNETHITQYNTWITTIATTTITSTKLNEPAHASDLVLPTPRHRQPKNSNDAFSAPSDVNALLQTPHVIIVRMYGALTEQNGFKQWHHVPRTKPPPIEPYSLYTPTLATLREPLTTARSTQGL